MGRSDVTVGRNKRCQFSTQPSIAPAFSDNAVTQNRRVGAGHRRSQVPINGCRNVAFRRLGTHPSHPPSRTRWRGAQHPGSPSCHVGGPTGSNRRADSLSWMPVSTKLARTRLLSLKCHRTRYTIPFSPRQCFRLLRESFWDHQGSVVPRLPL
jgi:hypothetical protein